ncbi:DUF418 domain-containing protein [Alteromonas portus]|uniref:DUF418 domain-containing protein n=1 Tax=Alteromonas portus TaxID=2565549 RepID=A0A4U0ZAQ6_9ALTE|nr:DUF418 domain-containing protein [Alteromonas portus]TKB02869.1 DUF418 domain-containing protein [Alteromonas portus]
MRIQSIDAIRGLAILGILFLNIAYHQNFHTGYAFFEAPLLSDEIISTVSALFLDGRFRTLFCLLFGAGLAIQFDACQKRGHNFLDFSKSRLKWLFLFGLIHGVFIFGGDILLYYSLCAYFVLKHLTLDQEALRAKSVKYLVVGSIIMLVFGIVLTLGYDYGGAPPLRSSEAYAEEVTEWQSSYLFQIGVQASFVLATVIAAPFSMLWQSMGLMMFGAYLYRSDFFNLGFSSAVFKKVAIIAIATSVITVIPQIMFEQVTSDVIPMFTSIPAIFCAFAYAHLLIKVKNTTSWWYQSLINCGKVAFTLYLTQSIVLAVLFRVIMPAYYPEFAYTVTLLDLMLITLALTAIQILLANFITKNFEQGPFEAAWRTLYLRSFYKKQQSKQDDGLVEEQELATEANKTS